MNRATPKMRRFARRLIAFEGEPKSSPASSPPGFPVFARLRPHLTTFVGNTGYRALILRALALASADYPWLAEVTVQADGSPVASAELHAQIAPGKFLDGNVALLAQLLGLLVGFVGAGLTLRLVNDIWPGLPLDASEFDDGDKNEEEN